MVKYAYKAIDQQGGERFGILEAETEAEVLNEISRLGLIPTSVRKANISDELWLRWQDERQQRKDTEERKQQEARRRHTRQQLVVAYKDGRRDYGVCFALNPHESNFYLDKVDEHGTTTGTTENIRFADLKAVYYVKSYDGNFDKSIVYREVVPEGGSMVVEFNDGEVIKGFSLHRYDPDQPRFFLVPEDSKSNNITILVEQTATRGVYTLEQWRARREEERKRARETPVALTQEEAMGDFYFETRNYELAAEQYTSAMKKLPEARHLRKKLLYTQYNIGVQCIKRRDYAQALSIMEQVLKLDPGNSHAQKKVLQLRKIIGRSNQPQTEGDRVGERP